VLGDTAIIYSEINPETNEPYYDVNQLQQIADAAAALDKKEGLISFGYKVVNVKDLKAGKIEINPFNTYWEVIKGNPRGEAGLTYDYLFDPTGNNNSDIRVVGGYVSMGFLNERAHALTKLGGPSTTTSFDALKNAGWTVNHEVQVHGIKTIISSLVWGNAKGDGDYDHQGHEGGHGGRGRAYLSINDVYYSDHHKNTILQQNNAFTIFLNQYEILRSCSGFSWRKLESLSPLSVPHDTFFLFESRLPTKEYREAIEKILPYAYPKSE
jgi:hypothetical protein